MSYASQQATMLRYYVNDAFTDDELVAGIRDGA
jgi:hypothetical protein